MNVNLQVLKNKIESTARAIEQLKKPHPVGLIIKKFHDAFYEEEGYTFTIDEDHILKQVLLDSLTTRLSQEQHEYKKALTSELQDLQQ